MLLHVGRGYLEFEISESATKTMVSRGALLVGDQSDSAMVVESILANRGYDVSHDALQSQSNADGPRLVVVFVDGWTDERVTEFSQAVRASQDGGSVLIVAVAPGFDLEHVEHLLEIGYDDFILEPINPVDFEIRIAIAERRQRIRQARIDSEKSLRVSEERLELAFKGAKDGLWDWDLKSNTIFFSERWWEMLGFEPDKLGTSPDEWFSRVHPADTPRLQHEISKHIKGESGTLDVEIRILGRDGEYKWMNFRGLAQRSGDGEAHRIAGSMTDIADRGIFDPLTGLANRTLFLDRVGRAIERQTPGDAALFAVLFMDLDRFKIINDSLGHVVGDQLLIAMARRLEESLRSGDTIARLGGDEFAVLLEGVDTDEDVRQVAQSLHGEIAKPYKLGEHELTVTASIGIATSGLGLLQAEEYLRDSDTAMYSAKSSGAAFEIFSQGMRAKAVQTQRMEMDLRRALEREEFIVHYHPIVNIVKGGLEGFEALVRWRVPGRRKGDFHDELISPGEFVGLAEETGIIVPLGWWVLGQAADDIRSLELDYPMGDEFLLSVNLSPKQFTDSDPVGEVRKVLDESGLSPFRLKLELTESTLMDDPERAIRILKELKELGVQIAIDDFGTGYSSMNYLTRYPFDSLKIDQSFVQQMMQNQENYEIVKTIIALGRNLDKQVIAEGVEEEAHLDVLRQLGCEYAQGYFFSKPVNKSRARRMIANGQSWTL